MRVVFFGTPDFAVPSLRAILNQPDRFSVEAVITQPDRPHGRSRSTLVWPPVKTAALRADLPVLQPEKPVGDVFRKQLERLEPDVGVVVAYGHILRPEILEIPRAGMINLHASLLPRLRGAAPINWAILNGDAVTGVTVMQMEAGLDSGPILDQVETPIGPTETAGELTGRLADLGAQALVETLTKMRTGDQSPRLQDHSLATYAPKVDRALARIDWREDAPVVARRIRAFDPAPGAWTPAGNTELKLFGAIPVPGHGEPGTVVPDAEALVVVTGAGAVRVAEVQPAGRARMRAADWLRGRRGEPVPRLG